MIKFEYFLTDVLKSKHGLQPIMAHISVTYPGTVRFFLHPNNIWVLEVGRNYRIDVQLYDVDGNRMFITDVSIIFDLFL